MPDGMVLFPSMNGVVCQGPYGHHDSDEDVVSTTTGGDSVSLKNLNHKLYRTSSPVPRFPTFQSALFSGNVNESDEDDDESLKNLKRLEKLKREHRSETSSWIYYLFAKEEEDDDAVEGIEANDSLISYNRSFEGTFSNSGSEDELEIVENGWYCFWKRVQGKHEPGIIGLLVGKWNGEA